MIGTYALIGLYNYTDLDTSEPPEGLQERIVIASIMPRKSKQELRREEERKLAQIEANLRRVIPMDDDTPSPEEPEVPKVIV